MAGSYLDWVGSYLDLAIWICWPRALDIPLLQHFERKLMSMPPRNPDRIEIPIVPIGVIFPIGVPFPIEVTFPIGPIGLDFPIGSEVAVPIGVRFPIGF